MRFTLKAVQQRKENEYEKWLASWKDRQCTAADVKQRWLMILTQPVPDRLSAMYYKVLERNTALESALQSTAYDFEAQDIADQINIMRLTQKGLTADAADLERTRLERIRTYQQQQFQQKMLARQQAMQEQLNAQINQLRREVAAARSAAESHHHHH